MHQSGETPARGGGTSMGPAAPLCPPALREAGLPPCWLLVLAVENHVVMNSCIPGLQLFHLPSAPAHTSPTALSHPAGVFQHGRAGFGTCSTQRRAEAQRDELPSLGGTQGSSQCASVVLQSQRRPPRSPRLPQWSPFSLPSPPLFAGGMLHLTHAEPVTYPTGSGWTSCVPSGCSSRSDPARLGKALSAGGRQGLPDPPLPSQAPVEVSACRRAAGAGRAPACVCNGGFPAGAKLRPPAPADGAGGMWGWPDRPVPAWLAPLCAPSPV